MPIGPVTPGSYTTVTPDTLPSPFTSLPAPSPTMPVIAQDIAALTLAVLNVQDAVRQPALEFHTRYPLATRTLQRVSRLPIESSFTGGAPGWTLVAGTGSFVEQQSTTTSLTFRIHLELPQSSLLDIVDVWWKGAGVHGGLPQFMPKYEIFKEEVATGIQSTIQVETDNSASTAAYEARHMIEASSIGETIDNSRFLYYIEFTGEHGTNAITGLQFQGALITFVTTAQDDGAS